MGKEKKEIGKLLELLNEYETPRSGVVYKGYDDYDGFFYGVDIDGETEISWSDSLICSKKFGWIGWLVENDKIKIPSVADELPPMYGYDYSSNECKSDRLIMLLSISDEPIRFLISVLK